MVVEERHHEFATVDYACSTSITCIL